ncbi:hypothetical protein RvY_13586 [Ramazzottius varieornatus]|uniref:Uncharacterized protein n=1 Tax=Ramazzottius varieornatus TaxID=947166 RepID=A0A1D1VQJ1_RAMVA|nr:hypothetical protein RvY_13586 [Ramazzottius varieornatus]
MYVEFGSSAFFPLAFDFLLLFLLSPVFFLVSTLHFLSSCSALLVSPSARTTCVISIFLPARGFDPLYLNFIHTVFATKLSANNKCYRRNYRSFKWHFSLREIPQSIQGICYRAFYVVVRSLSRTKLASLVFESFHCYNKYRKQISKKV